MATSKPERIKRDTKELLKRLIHHIELLVEYSEQSFYHYQHEKYLGEVTGKLRVLTIDYGRNKPLLLDLMKHFEYEREFKSITPKTIFTLRSYMLSLAGYSKGKFEFTHEKMIRYLSQQTGASHEDWALDEELNSLLYDAGVRSNSSSFIQMTVRKIVNTVLSDAAAFLLYLYQNGEFEKYNINYSLPKILALDVNFPQAMDWSLQERQKRNINIKPVRHNLDTYTRSLMGGRLNSLVINIDGIVPKNIIRKHGYVTGFDQKTKKFIGYKSRIH